MPTPRRRRRVAGLEPADHRRPGRLGRRWRSRTRSGGAALRPAHPMGRRRCGALRRGDGSGFNLGQWGLSNTGQVCQGPRAGTAGDDISALAAWGMSRGAGVTVGVVDSGAQFDHPDLQAQLIAGHDYIDRDESPHGRIRPRHAGVRHPRCREQHRRRGRGRARREDDAVEDPQQQWNRQQFKQRRRLGPRRRPGLEGRERFPTAPPGYSNAEETAIRTHPNTLYVAAAGNGEQERRRRAAVSVRLPRRQHHLRRRPPTRTTAQRSSTRRRPRAMAPRPSTSSRPA